MLLNRLSHILFFLLVFFLPSQLGKHFWIDESLVLGRRIDYLSPTLFFTDILLFLFLITNGIIFYREKKHITHTESRVVFFYWLLFGVNMIVSTTPLVSFIKGVRLFSLVLYGLIIIRRKPALFEVAVPLSLAVFYSSILAMFQFLFRGSLGGIWWLLGERTFSSATPGIAQSSVLGALVLRPYATFPHPNVLAGFIVVSFPLVFRLLNQKSYLLRAWGQVSLSIGFLALVLSLSRSAWVIGIVLAVTAFLIWYREITKVIKKTPKAWLFIFTVVSSVIVFLTSPLLVSVFRENTKSIAERFVYAQTAFKMTTFSPTTFFFGLGLNGFLSRLPQFLDLSKIDYAIQPVHSVPLLVWVETGFLGLSALFVLLYKAMKNCFRSHNVPLLFSLTALILLSFNDHYFFTLQQTQLLSSLILGMAFTDKTT